MIFPNTSFAYPAIVSVVYFPGLLLEREFRGTEVCVVHDPSLSHEADPLLR